MIEARVERVVKSRARVLGSVLAAAVVALLVVLGTGEAAQGRPPIAHTFTVNSTGDQADANLENSLCDVDLVATGNQCTFRAAIQEANDTPNGTFNGNSVNDVIRFNIAGSGVQTIEPLSALPAITDAVTIDGYTQPGATENTNSTGAINAKLLIELTGANASNAVGLSLAPNSSNSVVRGLVINRFFDGILIDSGGIKIEGNFLGTDPSGLGDLGNARGVDFFTFTQGGTVVGGDTPAARNLISGNEAGIFFQRGSADQEVRGNLIGTKTDGTSALGNDDGVVVLSGSTNTVRANTIAFSQFDGVVITDFESNIENRILSNSIFSNGDLGIDLEGGTENAAGATANDPKDPDDGPNDLQNKPVLTSAATSSGATTVRGNLNSTPAKTFKIQFFSNPSGNEGKKFIGQKTVTTGADGLVTFTLNPTQRVPLGQTVTATATDPEGNTSEFSAARSVVAQ